MKSKLQRRESHPSDWRKWRRGSQGEWAGGSKEQITVVKRVTSESYRWRQQSRWRRQRQRQRLPFWRCIFSTSLTQTQHQPNLTLFFLFAAREEAAQALPGGMVAGRRGWRGDAGIQRCREARIFKVRAGGNGARDARMRSHRSVSISSFCSIYRLLIGGDYRFAI